MELSADKLVGTDGNSPAKTHTRYSIAGEVHKPATLTRICAKYCFPATLAVLLLAPFAGYLVVPDGKVIGNKLCDNPQSYFYLNQFAGDCWRNGIVPLWNPYVMLGYPFVGDGEASVFHPFSALFVFLQTGIAINWLISLSFLLTGLFYFGYLRALGLGKRASWCGTVTLCFSSLIISRIYAGHLNILLSFISIPLILMLWERFRTTGRMWHLAGISLAYASMILAFYPLVLYIFSLFLLLYVLIQSLPTWRNAAMFRKELKSILLLGAFTCAGILAGSIQFFPSVDFLNRSFREQSSIEFCGMFSFPLENLTTMLAPGFFGTELNPNSPNHYWGRSYYWEMWIYAGILPLVMAVVGVTAAPRARSAALLICTGVFMAVGFGKFTPLFRILYEYVPLFDAFRGSSRYMIIPLFCVITLSAHGLNCIFEETDPRKRRQAGSIALAAAAFLLIVTSVLKIAFTAHAGEPGSNWEQILNWMKANAIADRYLPFEIKPGTISSSAGNAAFSLLWALVFAALSAIYAGIIRNGIIGRQYLFPCAAIIILADLSGTFLPMLTSYDVSITRHPKRFDSVLKEFPEPYPPRILDLSNPWPNKAMYHKYSSVFGYTGNTLKRYNNFLNRIQNLSPENSMATQMVRNHTKYFRMLAIDAQLADAEQIPSGFPGVIPIADMGLLPYDRFPRTFLAAGPRYFNSREESLEYIMADTSDVLLNPAVERADGDVVPQPLNADESARIISFSPTRVEIEAHSDHPRTLVMCDMYSVHWKAKVNGDPNPVFPANYVFRAIEVPPGKSSVILEYKPIPFYLGAMVSAVSVAALLGIFGFDCVGFRRKIRLRQPGLL